MSDNKEVSGAVKEIARETAELLSSMLIFSHPDDQGTRAFLFNVDSSLGDRVIAIIESAITRALSGQEDTEEGQRAFDPTKFWNGWSHTYDKTARGYEKGYIIHFWKEGKPRALCGARIVDGGGLNLTESEPGCVKCRRALRKLGWSPQIQ